MTVKELINQLSECNEDVLDAEVGIILRMQINKDVRLTARAVLLEVPQNYDVDANILWLKARDKNEQPKEANRYSNSRRLQRSKDV